MSATSTGLVALARAAAVDAILREGGAHRRADLAARLGVDARSIQRATAVLRDAGMPLAWTMGREEDRGLYYTRRAPRLRLELDVGGVTVTIAARR